MREAGLQERVTRLERIIECFDPFDLIAWVAFDNLAINPDDYSEPKHTGSAARIEYLTLLCLTKPLQQGRQSLPTPAQFEELRELLNEIFSASIFSEASTRARAAKQPDDVDRFAQRMQLHELLVRAPGYQHHQEHLLSILFTPFDEDLRLRLGFTADDAMALMHAVRTEHHQRLQERLEWAFGGYEEVRQFELRKRKGKKAVPPAGVPRSLLDMISTLRDDELENATATMALNTAMAALGDVLALTAHDLARVSDMPIEVAQSFLERFSLRFGEVKVMS